MHRCHMFGHRRGRIASVSPNINYTRATTRPTPQHWSAHVFNTSNPPPSPPVLPASNLDYIGFAKYWASVGISIADAATLLGVHSAIDNENGGPPAQWSSILYQSQVCVRVHMCRIPLTTLPVLVCTCYIGVGSMHGVD